jgi:hypothetical protein
VENFILVNIVANLLGKPRRETLNGREYLVASATMIVPGVLPGSAGALLYPDEEVARDITAWNGMPLTHRHPMLDGVPVSARNPKVAAKYQIGTVYNTDYDGRLRAEAWFDIELTNRIDPRIIKRIERGDPVELSTGLFTQNTPADPGANHNGIPYVGIARNYRPDHLAALIDDVGACSIRDGCGFNVNANYPEKCPHCGTALEIEPRDGTCNRCGKKVKPVTSNLENLVKEQLIAWLTANCACWKGPSASAALNAMTEPELQQLKTAAESTIALNQQHTALAGQLTAGIIVNGAKVTLGTDGKLKADQIAPVANNTPNNTPQPLELTPVGQPPVANRNETFIQLLDRTGTPEEKAIWNTAVGMHKQKKQELVDRLTANITDATAKAAAQVVYMNMKMEELEKIAPAAPKTPANNQDQTNNADFGLGAGGPLPNLNTNQKSQVVEVTNGSNGGGLPVGKVKFQDPKIAAALNRGANQTV